MHQALTRRYRRLKAGEAPLPDVLFIDGGRGQVQQARDVLAALGIDGVTLVGVAKGPDRKPGYETLYLSGPDTETILPADSRALHLIQQIRDEAHRFAITGHRQRRQRRRTTSPLEAIPGLGPKRRQQLLKQAINLPNKLTLLRIGLIPLFVLLFYVPLFGWNNVVLTVLFFLISITDWFDGYLARRVLFFLISITDWFDGYLARRLRQQSDLGAFLDPVADKLVVTIVLVLLVSKHPGWLLALPTVMMAHVGDEAKVAVSIIGKFKTATQMLAIGFLLYEQPIGDFPVLEIGYVLLYVAAFLTLWSMMVYLQAAWPSLNGDDSAGA